MFLDSSSLATEMLFSAVNGVSYLFLKFLCCSVLETTYSYT